MKNDQQLTPLEAELLSALEEMCFENLSDLDGILANDDTSGGQKALDLLERLGRVTEKEPWEYHWVEGHRYYVDRGPS